MSIDSLPYSLAILGGGINGVAIARDAAQRGLRVILFEKRDFGSGASSKSSKLVHGGLRYLTTFSLSLVKESLRESELLLKNAPHLVKPLPFLYPVYRNSPYPLWLAKLGISFYHWLKPNHAKRPHSATPAQISALIPQLTLEGLKGGCLYYDAQMQDNRLVIENMLSAEEEGAALYNYTDVMRVERSENGFQIESSAGTFYAKCLVNATGAWSNLTQDSLHLPSDPTVYPSKGVHLILPQVYSSHALALTAPQDRRLFFLIPWMGYSLLGTTDTPYREDPSEVDVEPEDIYYLLTALRHYFPHASERIIASYAALRPLFKKSSSSPSDVSREHQIHLSKEGILTLLGGKFTTYRQIAEEVVDTVVQFLGVKALPCRTHSTPLYGAQNGFHVNGAQKLQRLIEQYGKGAERIAEIIQQDPREGEQICPHHPHLFAELTYAIQKEKARCPEDWFQRRTSIAYSVCQGKQCYERVASRFK